MDFETVAGVSDDNGKRYNRLPCAMGYVKFMDGIPVLKKFCIINPNCHGKWSCIKANINSSMAQYGEPIVQLGAQLLDRDADNGGILLEESLPIVVHNASCEKEVLRTIIEIYNLRGSHILDEHLLDNRFVDTLEILKGLGEDHNTLSEACQRHLVPLVNAHDALEDAEACGQLFLKLQGLPMYIPSESSPLPISPEKAAKKKRDTDYLKPCPEDEIVNKNNPFYHKNVLFTGKFFEIDREELLVKLYYLGAYNKSSVSKSLEIAIIGADAGPSKMEKIMELAAQDKCLIVPEKMLLDILYSLE